MQMHLSTFIYLIQITQIHVIASTKSYGDEVQDKGYKSPLSNNFELFSSNFSDQEIVFRVLNGQPASIEEIPYQIALMRKIERGYWQAMCGGTIIGQKKVLTAAHCVRVPKLSDCTRGRRNSFDLSHVRVVAGQVYSFAVYGMKEGQWRRIKNARYPRNFRFPKRDIAIVHVYHNFFYNDAVQPIPYASKMIDYGGMVCLASGYGRVDRVHQSLILLKAYLTVVPMDICNLVHDEDFSTFVCTSDFNSDLRQGDSGGPLVCKNTNDPAENGSSRGIVVGVVSGKDFKRKLSTFFTRVSSYHNFISVSSKIKASPLLLSCNFIFLINYLRTQF